MPTYKSEGKAFGKFLAAADKPVTVASLAQNDDVGKDYVDGLEEGIKGSQVKIVAKATYNVTDPTVDAQVTQLAATHADVFFSADVQVPLTIASLQKAQQLGWTPAVFLPSNTSAKDTILDPGRADAYPAIYTTGFSISPSDPAHANDADVKKFLGDMKADASDITSTIVPQCVWGYEIGATLEATFKAMKAPTRVAFMDASRTVKIDAPLLVDGVKVDTTHKNAPAVDVTKVSQFKDGTYSDADPDLLK